MRNLLIIGAAVLAVVACQKPENELGVNTDLPLGTGAGNLPQVAAVVPALADQLWDDDPNVAGVQAAVVVRFTDYMDEGSVLTNVGVLNTTTGMAVTGLEVSYNADARTLYVRHQNWSQSSAYLLTVTTGGAKNRWNSPLDGNGNTTGEGTPYDDFLTTFFTTGSAPESCVSTVPPRVAMFDPDTIRVSDTARPIAVQFTAGMDTTTFVAANFQLTDGTGSSVPLDRVGFTPTSVSFRPRPGSPLLYGKIYTMTLTSSTLKSDAPAHTPEHVRILDADGDGPESGEPNYASYFLCDTLDAPGVDVSNTANGLFFDFTADMDDATLVPENVRAFDEDGYVPGTFVFLRENGDTKLGYYFSRPVNGSLRAFVAKAVKAKNGRYLDADGNGIGNEPWDDYWWP